MWNKLFQQRSTQSLGIGRRVAEDFYRPSQSPRPVATSRKVSDTPTPPEQLKLDFSRDRALSDVFEDFD